jgi:hypothetical protein
MVDGYLPDPNLQFTSWRGRMKGATHQGKKESGAHTGLEAIKE